MAEFLIKGDDLTSLRGKVVIVIGTTISPPCAVFVITINLG